MERIAQEKQSGLKESKEVLLHHQQLVKEKEEELEKKEGEMKELAERAKEKERFFILFYFICLNQNKQTDFIFLLLTEKPTPAFSN